jgi:hypothetical protein
VRDGRNVNHDLFNVRGIIVTCVELAPMSERHSGNVESLVLCPFPVTIDRTLATSAGMPRLYIGHDADGRSCLLAQIGGCWVWALSSDLAIRCLLAGTATPDALFRHSLTGTIESIGVDENGRLVESTRLCGDVGEDEYRFAGRG